MTAGARTRLPQTARDVFLMRPAERPLYNALVAFFEATGWWKHPVRAAGALESMGFWDKVYWLYKTTNPTTRARRGSGLEAFFAGQPHGCELPRDLVPEVELSLSSVGDLMRHPYLERSRDTLFREVSDLVFGADVSMANLECPVLETSEGTLEFSPRNGPRFCLSPAELDLMNGSPGKGFTFLATACNHSLDFGPEGVDATLEALSGRGIASHGMNASAEDAHRAAIVEKKGFKLGVVAWTLGLNARRPPKDRPGIVNRIDLDRPVDEIDFSGIGEQLAHCRSEAVDFVVAHLHWGMEHELYPTPEQLEIAHRLAELGVDAIIGHHPHVGQPVEYYRTKRDPQRVVPVFYSLGNLINPFSAPYLCLSQVARLKLVKGRWLDGSPRTYVGEAGCSRVFQVANDGDETLCLSTRSP
ncbi:MAG: CapA family protein [Myxococcaceae bacterium]